MKTELNDVFDHKIPEKTRKFYPQIWQIKQIFHESSPIFTDFLADFTKSYFTGKKRNRSIT
jgi:hypothetical protein